MKRKSGSCAFSRVYVSQAVCVYVFANFIDECINLMFRFVICCCRCRRRAKKKQMSILSLTYCRMDQFLVRYFAPVADYVVCVTHDNVIWHTFSFFFSLTHFTSLSHFSWRSQNSVGRFCLVHRCIFIFPWHRVLELFLMRLSTIHDALFGLMSHTYRSVMALSVIIVCLYLFVLYLFEYAALMFGC